MTQLTRQYIVAIVWCVDSGDVAQSGGPPQANVILHRTRKPETSSKHAAKLHPAAFATECGEIRRVIEQAGGWGTYHPEELEVNGIDCEHGTRITPTHYAVVVSPTKPLRR